MTNSRVSVVHAGLLLCVCVFGKDGPSAFTGIWDIDRNQSTATAAIPEPLEQQIKQKKSEIVIKSKWVEPPDGVAPLILLGVMTTELKLKTNGNQVKKQFGPFMTTTVTTQDGDSLVTKWQVNANGEPLSSEWRRTLSPDGTTMTLEIQQTTAKGANTNAKLVFRRR